MALSTDIPKTSWASSLHAFLLEQPNGGAMPSVTYEANATGDLGLIDEDGFSIETADGEEIQLKDINGALIDSLKKEPEMTININLLKPSFATRGKFWEYEETGSSIRIKSLINADHYAFAIGNVNVPGSETFEAPNVAVSAKPTYSASKGWIVELQLKVLKGGTNTDYLFDFGLVPSDTTSVAPATT